MTHTDPHNWTRFNSTHEIKKNLDPTQAVDGPDPYPTLSRRKGYRTPPKIRHEWYETHWLFRDTSEKKV